ncbi:MAG: hypothetical protein J6U39_04215 [Clostridia bacterium]|nr:hypothetical protein [Clostridia bacterium]
MSEYYFDYKCISAAAPDRSDKALDFYLYQDVEKTGMMSVRVYVPKEMREKYFGAKVWFSPGDVAFPDIESGEIKPEIWYSVFKGAGDREDNYIDTDNCIYIKNIDENLSGCGVIAFIEGQDMTAPPKEKDIYEFVINYARKEIISYRVIERRSSVRVEVIYPLLRENIELGIKKKPGAKPILVKDFKDEAGNRTFDESDIIVLHANGRKEDVVKKVISVDDPRQYDFRLVFLKEELSSHYLLVDESDYTIEDHSQRRKDMRMNGKVSVVEKHRCPYCGRPLQKLPRRYKKGETAIVGCDGREIALSTEDNWFKGSAVRVCALGYGDENAKKSYFGSKLLVIPEKYDEMPSMNVVSVGFTSSGKTILLASIINMEGGEHGRGITATSSVLSTILSSFGKKRRKSMNTVKEAAYLAVNIDKKELIPSASGAPTSQTRFKEDLSVEKLRSGRGGIKERLLLNANKKVESQSPKELAEKLSWNPIGFRVGDLGYAYFYDTPGEMYQFVNNEKVRALDMADCLIAVIDGAPEKPDPLGDLIATLEKLPQLVEDPQRLDMKNIPIAIVYTKHDLKLTEYLGKNKNRDNCFDDNCHVVRENILEMLPKNGKYKGSALERHIDCSSYELEQYLKAKCDPEKLKVLKEHYENIKFFTCSALGSDNCLGQAVNQQKDVLFKPRKLRVELPIIWLMYKKGLIKG